MPLNLYITIQCIQNGLKCLYPIKKARVSKELFVAKNGVLAARTGHHEFIALYRSVAMTAKPNQEFV